MRFTLVDQIVTLTPGAKITTIKTLSLAEEYLADHFPCFPVMPGVLMLEAMTQASAWLVRMTDELAHSMVVLKHAHNVRFRNFVAPGQVLLITAEIARHDATETLLTVSGSVGDAVVVSGRLVLDRYNLADARPELAANDEYIKCKLRELLSILYRPRVASLA